MSSKEKPIKISDRFSIYGTEWNWVLVEHKEGKSKDGEPRPYTKEMFFGRLEHAAKHIVNEVAKDAGTLAKIGTLINVYADSVAQSLRCLTGKPNAK